MTRLFGTDGVRGIANEELSPELAFRLGEAAGHFLGGEGRGSIVVGRDTRRSGAMLEAALVAGICSGGADALLADIVPTPAVAYLTRSLAADGGVVISASHNPAEYNGIKLFGREGFKLPDELEDEIEEFVIGDRSWSRPTGSGIGDVKSLPDAADRYVAHAIQSIDGDLTGMTIAVDCGHGASAITTPAALRELGATVISVNCDYDGMDINDGCGSTHVEVVSALVREHSVDLGISHDGDADRVIAVDETGEEIDGDTIMAVCAADLKERGALSGDVLVGTVMSNMGLEIAMKERGITFVKTKVGDRYVLEQMLSSGAVLGGEQSGHLIFMEYATTGDGLITALQLASVMRRSGRPLSELRTIMRRYPQVLHNVHVSEKHRLAASHAITDAIHKAEAQLDGRGRVLVRASGTEPLVRVMAEAETEQLANDVVSQLIEVVKAELAG